MTTSKIVSLLIVGAVLAASPALAQGLTAGNQGPAEIPKNRDAPLNLPANVEPMPTPKVDAATTRDIFEMDPAQALESLRTITLERGGDTFETPASDALRAAFEAEMKGSKGQ